MQTEKSEGSVMAILVCSKQGRHTLSRMVSVELTKFIYQAYFFSESISKQNTSKQPPRRIPHC